MKQDWEIYRDTGILGAYRPEQVILGEYLVNRRCSIKKDAFFRMRPSLCQNRKGKAVSLSLFLL